jgi:hypothetical protein
MFVADSSDFLLFLLESSFLIVSDQHKKVLDTLEEECSSNGSKTFDLIA